MKRLSTIVVLPFLLLFALGSTGVPPTGFVGDWVLNRSKSEGLTGGLGNAEIIIHVTLDNKHLTTDQKIKIRGREQPSQPLVYNLDGTESNVEVVRPLAGTMSLKARILEKGQMLELTSTIDGENDGKPVTVITKEYWELVEGGKAMVITRTRETPGKSEQFKLYFEKVK